MSNLGRQEFLTATSKREFWEIPLATGGTVRARSITSGEARRIRKLFRRPDGEFDPDRGELFNELLIGACLVNGTDDLMFTEQEVLAGALSEMDNQVTAPLFNRLRKLTGMRADEDWAALEAAVKNSKTTPTVDSYSDSQPAAV